MDKQYKKITNGGAISIPSAVRNEMGLQKGQAMELEPKDDGSIVIRPYEYCCVFCGSKEDITVLHGKGVCSTCKQVLAATGEE